MIKYIVLMVYFIICSGIILLCAKDMNDDASSDFLLMSLALVGFD